MTTVVDAKVPASAFLLGEVLRGFPDVRLELVECVPATRQPIRYFWAVGDDLDAFEAGVRADDRVDELIRYDSGTNQRLYQLGWAASESGFQSALAAHDLILVSGREAEGTWWFRFWAQDREAFAAFYEDCRDADIQLDIDRMFESNESPDISYGLTPKQRETILLALANGYFEVPRDTSLTELGGELDISHQSVSRRLNRGLRTLIENTLANGPTAPDEWTDMEE